MRIIFWPSTFGSGVIKGIEPDMTYRAFLFNPVNGEEIDLGDVTPSGNGDWALPIGNEGWRVMPIFQDWVLVIEKRDSV